MRFIVNVGVNFGVFLAASLLFPTGFELNNWVAALVAAFVLALLNWSVKPLLFFLSLPLLMLTLGIFSVVINAALLELTAHLVTGFHFANFWWAMLIAVILAITNSFFNERQQGQEVKDGED
ncbi:phage holin family protein [Leuconostocaceae bacterium ESL0723]|nr:phage holin family protein [Lactobacillaceae bacterium L1_55_11]WEV54130.1 phage holin family protein [Leuconostocaceae bacterium ESL0723]